MLRCSLDNNLEKTPDHPSDTASHRLMGHSLASGPVVEACFDTPEDLTGSFLNKGSTEGL